jgi:DNA modification methylase
MVKGRYQGDWVSDVCTSRINDNDKKHHHWGQSASGMRDLMKRFVVPGQVICDPFLGGGTTGVVAVELGGEFIGIDKEEQCVEDTKRRILKQFETLKEAG